MKVKIKKGISSGSWAFNHQGEEWEVEQSCFASYWRVLNHNDELIHKADCEVIDESAFTAHRKEPIELGSLSCKSEESIRNKYFEDDVTEDKTLTEICDGIASLIEYKNKKYGNSVLGDTEPIFLGKCKAGDVLDKKINRVKNSPKLNKNDTVDLIGYLILTCKEFGWSNFDEFKD